MRTVFPFMRLLEETAEGQEIIKANAERITQMPQPDMRVRRESPPPLPLTRKELNEYERV